MKNLCHSGWWPPGFFNSLNKLDLECFRRRHRNSNVMGHRERISQLPCATLSLRFQATLTSICFGLAFSLLGRCTLSTPSSNSAFTLSASASSGTTKLRSKLPYPPLPTPRCPLGRSYFVAHAACGVRVHPVSSVLAYPLPAPHERRAIQPIRFSPKRLTKRMLSLSTIRGRSLEE